MADVETPVRPTNAPTPPQPQPQPAANNKAAGGKTKAPRVDRVGQGYAQCLSDLRRLGRAAYANDASKKSAVNDLLDTLEDGRDEEMRIEDIIRAVKTANGTSGSPE